MVTNSKVFIAGIPLIFIINLPLADPHTLLSS